MGTLTPQDHHNALIYATERVRQEAIYRLKLSEPYVYAFIDVSEVPDGWANKAGLVIEPGQRLAPYRHITYDTSKLDCSAFSCIPVDVLKRPSEKCNASACSFAEHTAMTFPVKDPKGNTLKKFTACGPGCYRRNKRRDPHTGLPSANGVLLADYINPQTGEKMCQYLNQNLITWAALPWLRLGKRIEGYNTVHVPGFGFGEDKDGGYDHLNNVKITEKYCNFFKRYFDEENGECYRSGWMKFVKFMFGQYFTNLSYDLANPQPGYLGIKFNPWWITLGLTVYTAGAHPFRIEKNIVKKNTISTRHPEKAAAAAAEKILKRHFDEEMVIDHDSLLDLIGSNSSASDKLMEVSDSIIDAALRLEVMGLNDKQAKRIMLKELLKRSSRQNSFSDSLKLVGITVAIKKSLFSRQVSERRSSGSHITERDALLLAKANLEAGEWPPAPFLDITKPTTKNLDGFEKTLTTSEIWTSLLKKYSNKIDLRVSEFAKDMVVNLVRQFLDIVEGKIFLHGNAWENNVPLMIGADNILKKVMEASGRLCTKFVTSLESRAVAFSSDYVSSLPSKVAVEVASRTFGVLLEESVIEYIVSAAIRTAIQAFAALAELAASTITAIGIIMLVVTVLGIMLDLALKMDWYDSVLQPEDINKVVKVFQAAFAEAANVDEGEVASVSAEEIVSIDVESQIRNETEILTKDGEGDLNAYLEKSFNESPLLGKSRVAFIREAAEEYLAGRTMNAYGQRIIHEGGQEHVTQRTRLAIAETAKAVQDYSKVVNYNVSRMDYVGENWFKEEAGGDSQLFRETVTYSAVAGFSLVMGVGVLIVSHVSFVRAANIGLAFAFLGLLIFITLTGICYINLYTMGEANAAAIRALDAVGERQDGRIGAMQRLTSSGAKFNMISDFVNPMLEKVAS